MRHQIFKSTDTNVSKFVFENDGDNGSKPIAVEAALPVAGRSDRFARLRGRVQTSKTKKKQQSYGM